jgi:hypothetical protein
MFSTHIQDHFDGYSVAGFLILTFHVVGVLTIASDFCAQYLRALLYTARHGGTAVRFRIQSAGYERDKYCS